MRLVVSADYFAKGTHRIERATHFINNIQLHRKRIITAFDAIVFVFCAGTYLSLLSIKISRQRDIYDLLFHEEFALLNHGEALMLFTGITIILMCLSYILHWTALNKMEQFASVIVGVRDDAKLDVERVAKRWEKASKIINTFYIATFICVMVYFLAVAISVMLR